MRGHQCGAFVSPILRCIFRALQVLCIRVPVTLGSTLVFVPCSPRFLMFVVGVFVITLKRGQIPLPLLGFV